MMEVKVFMHSRFREACTTDELRALGKLFYGYKKGTINPQNFGRDETYDRPPTVKDAELRHIHIQDETSKNWHLRYMRIQDKTSNTALVYCNGYSNPNFFLLLDILQNAHSYYKGGQFHLLRLAELAEEFRTKY